MWHVRGTYERVDSQQFQGKKKVSSSAKDGETVVISEDALDIPWAKNKIKEIGYELVSYESEPYEKKGFFHFGRK